jgi:hypothetical protein
VVVLTYYHGIRIEHTGILDKAASAILGISAEGIGEFMCALIGEAASIERSSAVIGIVRTSYYRQIHYVILCAEAVFIRVADSIRKLIILESKPALPRLFPGKTASPSPSRIPSEVRSGITLQGFFS